MVVAGRRPARRRRRDHDGRGRGHREDHRADRRWRHRPDRGGRGPGPRGRQAVHQGAVRGAGRAGREGRQAGRATSPASWTTRTTSTPPSRRTLGDKLAAGAADRRQARARGRHRRAQGRGQGRAGRPVRGPREGDLRRLPRADQEGRPPADPARQGPHRRPWPDRHPAAVGRGRGHPAGARLGAVRARRDPDPGRHHAEHAPHGAAAGHAVAGDPQALHAQLQLPAVLHR